MKPAVIVIIVIISLLLVTGVVLGIIFGVKKKRKKTEPESAPRPNHAIVYDKRDLLVTQYEGYVGDKTGIVVGQDNEMIRFNVEECVSAHYEPYLVDYKCGDETLTIMYPINPLIMKTITTESVKVSTNSGNKTGRLIYDGDVQGVEFTINASDITLVNGSLIPLQINNEGYMIYETDCSQDTSSYRRLVDTSVLINRGVAFVPKLLTVKGEPRIITDNVATGPDSSSSVVSFVHSEHEDAKIIPLQFVKMNNVVHILSTNPAKYTSEYNGQYAADVTQAFKLSYTKDVHSTNKVFNLNNRGECLPVWDVAVPSMQQGTFITARAPTEDKILFNINTDNGVGIPAGTTLFSYTID